MIERAIVEDGEDIEELENLLFDNALNATSIRRELELGEGFVVRDLDQVLVGYILTREAGGWLDITRLGVKSTQQGKGVGRLLLRAAYTLKPALPIMLTVLSDNTAARALYSSEGFTIRSWLPQGNAIVLEKTR